MTTDALAALARIEAAYGLISDPTTSTIQAA